MIKKLSISLVCIIVCAHIASHAEEAPEQLAEVLVLPFANETGKKEYEWLSKNIPSAVVDSMQQKFRFTLMTRDRFEEIVVLSKAKDPVLFRAHTDEKEISKISKVVQADIIIYGKYGYNPSNKTVAVNAFIYHRSRQKTTGTIDMETPVTSEMFKLVDKVADSVIEHIAVIAKEDAEAARKAGEKIADDTAKKQDEKITLVRRETPIGKSYRIAAGVAFTGGLGYFSDMLATGLAGTFGITNSEQHFWHYGLSISTININGNDANEYGIIEWMWFNPITVQGGASIRMDFFTIVQPFAGIGISFDVMRVGKEKIFVSGQIPLRDETDTLKWYLNPVFTAGLRLPISLWNFYLAPFAQIYVYTGKTADDERTYGSLVLLGLQLYW